MFVFAGTVIGKMTLRSPKIEEQYFHDLMLKILEAIIEIESVYITF